MLWIMNIIVDVYPPYLFVTEFSLRLTLFQLILIGPANLLQTQKWYHITVVGVHFILSAVSFLHWLLGARMHWFLVVDWYLGWKLFCI